MQEIYRTISKSLLYSDVIEHDGRLGKEPTLLGAFGASSQRWPSDSVFSFSSVRSSKVCIRLGRVGDVLNAASICKVSRTQPNKFGSFPQ
jgi:hypothetical protein